ncbi:MAG: 3-dehydroquinate synthase [Lachnospiraceae bacterium]
MSKRLEVFYESRPCYDIVLEDSFFPLTEELIKLDTRKKRLCIVTDSRVEKLYGSQVKAILETAAEEACIFSFPEGEASKTLDTVKELYRFLIEHHFERKDMLIALGGGVVGDLTGYAAATYLRGIDFIQIPTSLLAQVDSSIGGKTGVDFDQYKNMVGAFKMPRLVYINISTLNSLDERQFYNGFAEVMKHGLIKDSAYYEWMIGKLYEISNREPLILEEMVYRSCQIKKAVVEKDPTEKGDRALLNFGHTIGHAIEKYMNFSLLHGECIALGSVAAAFISRKRGLISGEEYYEIRDMFVPFNLPISIENVEADQILALTKSDKKMEQGQIKFILLNKVGEAFIEHTVTDEEILGGIEEIIYRNEE